jgi:pyridoxal phosphate enzyme (YggS family)
MSIAQNYQEVASAIAEACSSVGREVGAVRLLSVSKNVEMALVEEAAALGHHAFGENRAPQFNERATLHPEWQWHFIGRIQTNKLHLVVGQAALIHSVASAHALNFISRLAKERSCTQDILLEVNTSGEESKDGCAPADLPGLLEQAAALPNIRVRGLMTMAPIGDKLVARRTFEALRLLEEQQAPHYADCPSVRLQELSMGMSGDFPEAIAEGATILRIGTRLWV